MKTSLICLLYYRKVLFIYNCPSLLFDQSEEAFRLGLSDTKLLRRGYRVSIITQEARSLSFSSAVMFIIQRSEEVILARLKVNQGLGGTNPPNPLTILGLLLYPGSAIYPPVASTTQTMGPTTSSLTRVLKKLFPAMTSAMGGLSW